MWEDDSCKRKGGGAHRWSGPIFIESLYSSIGCVNLDSLSVITKNENIQKKDKLKDNEG